MVVLVLSRNSNDQVKDNEILAQIMDVVGVQGNDDPTHKSRGNELGNYLDTLVLLLPKNIKITTCAKYPSV